MQKFLRTGACQSKFRLDLRHQNFGDLSTMFQSNSPCLLYVYPWMPYPRRVIIYLAEKGISPSLVTIVSAGNFPGDTASATPGYRPPPLGSLPILAIPKPSASDADGKDNYLYIRQTAAIINYLEDLCDTGTDGFPILPSMRGATPMERARNDEIYGLAEECLSLWNPLRLTGSKMKERAEGNESTSNPKVSKDIYGLLTKRLRYVEKFLGERERLGFGLDGGNKPSIVDVTLFGFLEFVDGFYGRDVTEGFEKLRAFYHKFGKRQSVKTTFVEYPEEMAKTAREWDPAAL
jgi:glutathione S-transferase